MLHQQVDWRETDALTGTRSSFRLTLFIASQARLTEATFGGMHTSEPFCGGKCWKAHSPHLFDNGCLFCTWFPSNRAEVDIWHIHFVVRVNRVPLSLFLMSLKPPTGGHSQTVANAWEVNNSFERFGKIFALASRGLGSSIALFLEDFPKGMKVPWRSDDERCRFLKLWFLRDKKQTTNPMDQHASSSLCTPNSELRFQHCWTVAQTFCRVTRCSKLLCRNVHTTVCIHPYDTETLKARTCRGRSPLCDKVNRVQNLEKVRQKDWCCFEAIHLLGAA